MSASNGRAKGGGSRAAASAARKEKGDKPKKFEFEGLGFDLPAALPDTILFDMAEIEVAGENPLPMFRMLRSILGPQQFAELRGAVESETIKADQLDAFIEGVFEQYGITAGESSASPR